MATTAQWVFDKAMHLMDEANPSSGATDTADTKEYKSRTLAILNVLGVECYPKSDTYAVTEPGKRPIFLEIEDFITPMVLDDGIARGVLPYGLAAQLFLDENSNVASFFNQKYEELLRAAGRSIPAVSQNISLPFGGIGFSEYGRW